MVNEFVSGVKPRETWRTGSFRAMKHGERARFRLAAFWEYGKEGEEKRAEGVERGSMGSTFASGLPMVKHGERVCFRREAQGNVQNRFVSGNKAW